MDDFPETYDECRNCGAPDRWPYCSAACEEAFETE